MFREKCTKCKDPAFAHRQRDSNRWALEECANSGCFCTKFSQDKRLIGKFTSQGIPLNITKQEHNDWFVSLVNRPKIEKDCMARLGIKLRYKI